MVMPIATVVNKRKMIAHAGVAELMPVAEQRRFVVERQSTLSGC